jgi:DNA-binding transcriptional LysR family regulator
LSTPIAVVVAAGSRFAGARSLGDLTGAQWIMIGAPNGPGDIFRQPFIDHVFAPPRALTTCESYFAALSLVESLGAACTVPLRLLEDVRAGWRIRAIAIRETIAPLEIALMTRAGQPLTPTAEAPANCIRRRAETLRRR